MPIQRKSKKLQESKIDLGFIEGHSGKSSLKYEPVMDDEIVAVVHRNHPLFLQEEISINELKEQDFVLRENGSGSLDVIADIFNKNQISLKDLKVQAQLGSTESIKTFLEYSDCIGFLSIHSLRNELLSGTFKVLEIENFNIKDNSMLSTSMETLMVYPNYFRFLFINNHKL